MSTLKVTNIQATGETASRAVSGVAAAWVNFNGSGTIAARDSVNVASLTDNGTGDYDVNFSNNMGNANYCSTSASRNRATGSTQSGNAVSSKQIQMYETASGSASDVDNVNLAIHGDLA